MTFNYTRGSEEFACQVLWSRYYRSGDPCQDLQERYSADVNVCVPITSDGLVDPRWGRADRIAVANVGDGKIENWEVFEVLWSRLHDEGTPARHHARVARFLRENDVEAVVAHHGGDGMVRMLDTMGVPLYLEATGDARAAVLTAIH